MHQITLDYIAKKIVSMTDKSDTSDEWWQKSGQNPMAIPRE